MIIIIIFLWKNRKKKTNEKKNRRSTRPQLARSIQPLILWSVFKWSDQSNLLEAKERNRNNKTHAIILHCVKMIIQIFMVDSVGVLRCFGQHQPENDNAPKIDLNKVFSRNLAFSYTKCCRFRCPFFCFSSAQTKNHNFWCFFFVSSSKLYNS